MTAPEDSPAGIQLPPTSLAAHKAIAQKAAENLGKLVDGNGLKADQVKITREETTIDRIDGYISVRLAAQTQHSRVKGRIPQGTTVGSASEVTSAAEGQIDSMLKDGGIRQMVAEALKKDPGQGFAMESVTIPLPGPHKDFSVIVPCGKCNGNAITTCSTCGGSGSAACPACGGNGFSNCMSCQGMGRVPDASGTYVPCPRCQSSGKIFCATCRGQRTISCTACRGQGRIGCSECGQTGSFTEIYKVAYTAQYSFEINFSETSTDGRTAAHKLGQRQLATEKHAEIIWQEPQARPADIYIPCIAFLPLAKAEFAIEGHAYPATVAGLQGRIIEIEPVLDEYLKPGINALMNLSKGPLARQALIDTACKYRLIRQTMAGLARFSQKNVYQRLNKSYPLMLSEKYAAGIVKYAANAVKTLSTRPRYQGLAAGTLLSASLMAGYFLAPLRHALTGYIPPLMMLVADIVLWLISWGITVCIIKYLTAQELKKLLHGSSQISKGGLPSAGMQGWIALGTTGAAWLLIAFFAAEKPVWIQHFLK